MKMGEKRREEEGKDEPKVFFFGLQGKKDADVGRR